MSTLQMILVRFWSRCMFVLGRRHLIKNTGIGGGKRRKDVYMDRKKRQLYIISSSKCVSKKKQ